MAAFGLMHVATLSGVGLGATYLANASPSGTMRLQIRREWGDTWWNDWRTAAGVAGLVGALAVGPNTETGSLLMVAAAGAGLSKGYSELTRWQIQRAAGGYGLQAAPAAPQLSAPVGTPANPIPARPVAAARGLYGIM